MTRELHVCVFAAMTDKGVGEAAADIVVVRVDAHVGDRGWGW